MSKNKRRKKETNTWKKEKRKLWKKEQIRTGLSEGNPALAGADVDEPMFWLTASHQQVTVLSYLTKTVINSKQKVFIPHTYLKIFTPVTDTSRNYK
jgi:hypothetical protein